MSRLKDFTRLYVIYRQRHGPIKAARYAATGTWAIHRGRSSPSTELSRAAGVGLNELLGRWPGDLQMTRKRVKPRPSGRGKESAKPVRASLGATDQSAAVAQEHQPCEPFPTARA